MTKFDDVEGEAIFQDFITSQVYASKKEAVRQFMIEIGGRYRETPVHLATGEDTHVYLDVKGVLTNGHRMNLAADVMIGHIKQLGIGAPTAVGGPTMGADVLSHPMVCRNSEINDWFSIRDRVKTDHGMGKLIEGVELNSGHSVIIMDDVANSGKSLVEAVQHVRATGAKVLAVIPFVDRSNKTAAKMFELDVPYHPLFTSEDLGLAPLK